MASPIRIEYAGAVCHADDVIADKTGARLVARQVAKAYPAAEPRCIPVSYKESAAATFKGVDILQSCDRFGPCAKLFAISTGHVWTCEQPCSDRRTNRHF